MNKTALAGLIGLLASVPSYAADSPAAADVIVTASRLPQSRDDVLADITVISNEEIEQSGQSTLVDLLQHQPGVETSSNGGLGTSTSVFLRGSNNGHALVLVDGMRVGSVTLGETAFQHIQPDQIDHIEILRGPASSLYGSDAIGGVIQIFTKRGQGVPKPYAAVGYGSYGTRKLEAGYGGAVDGTRFNILASHLESDSFSSQYDQTGRNRDRDPYRNTSLSASLSHAFDENNEAGLSVLDSESHSHYDGFSSFDYRDLHKLLSWTAYSKNHFLPGWQSEIRIGQGIDDLSSTGSSGTNSFRTNQQQASWQNGIEVGIGTLLLGAEWLKEQVGGNTDYAVKERTTHSWLTGYLGKFGAHDLQANVRVDDSSQFGNRTTGAINYGYQFADHWRASVGFGTAFKAPTFNDLYFPDDGFGDIGNSNLKPEEARNREASLHWESGGQRASATYYDNHVRNLIEWQFNGVGFSPVNVAQARLRGLTLAWSGSLSGVLFRSSVDLQNPEDENTGNLLPRRARRHAAIWIGHNFGTLELGSELVTSGKRYDDADNNDKLGGYTLLNLTARYPLGSNWALEARANNVLDRDYELASGYNTPGANVFVNLRWQPK